MTGDEVEIYHLEDIHYEGPNLDLPAPPPGLPYERYEDWRSTELLAVNGIPATEEALLGALRTQEGVLLAAAAHAVGSHGVRGAIPQLEEVARGPDDNAGVEAAYALARLGDEAGKELLKSALERPVGPYLSPVFAAGYLAQLGDPSGFPVVREGLASDLLAVRMLACKQLAFFLPFPDLDARALLERALEDPDPSIRRQARAELPDGV